MSANKSSVNITIQAFWVAMGSLSSFALAIVSAAILARYFDKIEYGTYKQILYVYNTLLVVFTAGLPKVFSYYLPRYELSKGKDVTVKVTKMLFVAGLIFSVFLFASADIISQLLRNPDLANGLRWFSPIPALLLPTLGLEGIFASYGKAIYIAIYNTVSRILMLIFIVAPVVLFHGSYIEAIYGWIIVSVICLIIGLLMIRIPYKGVSVQKSGLKLNEIFAYSLPLVGASLAGIAIKSSSQFFISRYYGVDTFADFSNGFIDIPFVGMITGATSVVLMPVFSKLIHEKTEIEPIIELWKRTLLKSAYLIYPIVLFFIFYSTEIIELLFTKIYSNSVVYFQIAMFVNFFNIIIFGPLLFSLGQTRFYARLHLFFAFISWVGCYLLVLFINTPVSIAVFSVLIPIIMVIIALKKAAKMLSVSFFNMIPITKILKIVIHSLIAVSIIKILDYYLFSDFLVMVRLVLDTILFAIILIASSRLFKLNYLEVIIPLIKLKR